jgi:hypothetical protein
LINAVHGLMHEYGIVGRDPTFPVNM